MSCDPRTASALHCPFHDRGDRFSCHLSTVSSLPYEACIPSSPEPVLNACHTLAGRTLLFLGDSLTLQAYDTLRCQLCDSRAPCIPNVQRPNRSKDAEYVATYREPRCACFGACGTVCFMEAGSRKKFWIRNTSDAVRSVLQGNIAHVRPAQGCAAVAECRHRKLNESDLIIVANDGLWYTEGDHWTVASDRGLQRANELGRIWQQSKSAHPSTCLIWRETGPQHFASRSGTFRTQRAQKSTQWVSNSVCRPHSGTASPWEPVNQLLENVHGIPVVRVWNHSREHWDKHIANRTKHMQYWNKIRGHNMTTIERRANSDCSHWCTPGVVDVWIELIMRTIASKCNEQARGHEM